jgi:hypothetical protein
VAVLLVALAGFQRTEAAQLTRRCIRSWPGSWRPLPAIHPSSPR